MGQILEFILHLDKHLGELVRQHGPWTYGILFSIIFAETGLVIFPFLPGDSLLFAIGILSHPDRAAFNPWWICVLLPIAAVLGDNLNYYLGRTFGERLFRNENSKIFKHENLAKTHEFFEKHGTKTIVLARFVPIVRTLAPFVAGMGEMPYGKFLLYSVSGGIFWVWICVWAGYFFGAIPAVRDNFSLALLAMVLVTIIPIVLEYVKHRSKKASQANSTRVE